MLNFDLPEGLEVHGAFLISRKEHSLNDFISRYEYEVTIDKESDKQINSFMSRQQCLVSRENGEAETLPCRREKGGHE